MIRGRLVAEHTQVSCSGCIRQAWTRGAALWLGLVLLSLARCGSASENVFSANNGRPVFQVVDLRLTVPSAFLGSWLTCDRGHGTEAEPCSVRSLTLDLERLPSPLSGRLGFVSFGTHEAARTVDFYCRYKNDALGKLTTDAMSHRKPVPGFNFASGALLSGNTLVAEPGGLTFLGEPLVLNQDAKDTTTFRSESWGRKYATWVALTDTVYVRIEFLDSDIPPSSWPEFLRTLEAFIRSLAEPAGRLAGPTGGRGFCCAPQAELGQRALA